MAIVPASTPVGALGSHEKSPNRAPTPPATARATANPASGTAGEKTTLQSGGGFSKNHLPY